MKRELLSVLLGAALLVPVDADAQRNRNRGADRGPRASRPAPVTVSGRLAACRAPSGARPFHCAGRVVYSSHSGYVSNLNARIRIRTDWGLVRLHVGNDWRFDRQLNPGELRRLLGHRTFKAVRDAGRRAGLRGAPRGHWIDSRRHGLVLVVTMERVDVAEFVDFNRDGFIDDAFIYDHRRNRRVVDRW